MDNDRIDIYVNKWRTSLLIPLALLFVFGGWEMIHHPYGSRYPAGSVIFWGYIAVAFFSLSIIPVIAEILSNRPKLRIYEDRVEFYSFMRRKYQVVPFIDIGALELWQYKFGNHRILAKGPKTILAYRSHGFPYGLLTSSDVSNIDEVYEILNERYTAYSEKPVFNVTLDVDSLPEYIEDLGIGRDKYRFDEYPMPNVISIVRKPASIQVTLYNENSRIDKQSCFRIEENACRVALEHLIKQKILEDNPDLHIKNDPCCLLAPRY